MVKDEAFAAALPCIPRTNQLWMLSTPSGQTGTIYAFWHDASLSHWHRVKATHDNLDYAGT